MDNEWQKFVFDQLKFARNRQIVWPNKLACSQQRTFQLTINPNVFDDLANISRQNKETQMDKRANNNSINRD